MAAGISELQILLKARDEATKALKNAGSAGKAAGQSIGKHWKEASLVLAGAGLALEGLARSQAENTKAVQRFGAQTGMTNREVRDLATDLSNVTFPLDDVLGLLEQGAQRGIEGADALREYAKFWDMVGDATGSAGPELGKAGAALQAIGIAAGEEKNALAAFGFITDKTTGSVSDFLQFIDKTGPDLRAMGLDINDTAAFLAAMEKELGLTLIHRRTACRRPAEETKGCASESGIMVLKQKTGPRKGAPDRCYHVTTPTASKSPSTTTAWWPMPG